MRCGDGWKFTIIYCCLRWSGGMVEDYNRHAELECKLKLFGIYVREYRLTVACKDEAS